jgi:carbon monoxide dehydrogenase subunit G
MPTARASRSLSATSAAVWKIAADPHHLPRWWPRVARVERVSRREFTEVLRTPRGHEVRADFKVTDEDQGRRRVWSQQITGTPFEKYFTSVVVELKLAPQGDETVVTLEQRQSLRGISRFGGFLAKRAARKTLREALAGLEEAIP